MDAYQIIYKYLSTFPKDTTVGTLIANMDEAKSNFNSNQEKVAKSLKDEFVGNTYLYEVVDDGEVVCKYVAYVNGLNKSSASNISFECSVITMTENEIHYEESASVDFESLKMARKVSGKIFSIVKEKFDDLKGFSI